MSYEQAEFVGEIAQPDRVLVVDLDGTLIRSDMLFESFWSAFSARWIAPILVTTSLLRGRAALKQRLSQLAKVDVTSLPYNEKVIEYIRAWRASGGRTALVTAANETYAAQVAEHLDLFDEVFGSDGGHNLKGPNKAKFLVERYGEGGYDYMGDANADIPVWKTAGEAITVDAHRALQLKVEELGVRVQHISDPKPPLKPAIKALRTHQWLKNILIFLPAMLAQDFSAATLSKLMFAFISFSLVASSVYVLNDLLDLDADRAHPRKRFRPFASGDLPLVHGTWMAPALLVTGALIASQLGWLFMGVMVVYYIATTAYSLVLKRQLIIDICTLAGLYASRVMAGGAAADLPLTVWMIGFSIFLFFSLAAVKRQAELVDGIASGKSEVRGRGYQSGDLPIVTSMAIASGFLSVLILALYLHADHTRELYEAPRLMFGVCLILLYWISRMVMIAHRGEMDDDPVVFAVRDRVSQFCGLGVLLIAVVAANVTIPI